jgi:uncharacterized delta-60 repeat protein
MHLKNRFFPIRTILGTTAVAFCMAGSLQAAALAVDTNFQPPDFAKATPPERALLLPDGKYFLLFDPDTLTDQPAGPLTRFLSDGTLDTSFNFSREYKQVRAITPTTDNDGKFYVAATRYAYGTKETVQILRINNDGSLDPAFTPAVTASPDNFDFVSKLYVQPADGKILAIGYFSTVSGVARGNIVRLMRDGTVDPMFIPASIDVGEVNAITVQPDQKIILGGDFGVNGARTLGVARLNSDGSVDSDFKASGFALTAAIRCLSVQTDGSIILSGGFRIGSGFFSKRMPLVRLSSGGTLDSTFDSSGVVPGLPKARDFLIQSDDKIVALVNGAGYRFNKNGSKDASFGQAAIWNATVDPAIGGTPNSINAYNDGDFLVGGIFTDVDPAGPPGSAHFGVVRLNSDGTVDPSLSSSHNTGTEIAPNSFARLADGSTLVGFAPRLYPPIPYNVARLLGDGSLDPNFTLSSSDPDGFLSGRFAARGFESLGDGNFFVFGVQAATGGFIYGKVSASGVQDTSYNTEYVPYFQTAIADATGKVLISAGTDTQALVYDTLRRVDAEGHLESFSIPQSIRDAEIQRADSGTLITLHVGTRVLAIQPDGKIILEYLGSPNKSHLGSDDVFRLVRLNADGSVDSSFTAPAFTPFDLFESFPAVFDPQTAQTLQPFNGAWFASLPFLDAMIQSDGRIVLVGQFKSYNGTPARGIVRLLSDGTVDDTFNAGGGAQWTSTTETAAFFPAVQNIEPLADGTLLIAGTFEAFDGVVAPGMAHLNADGSVDTSFVAPVKRDKRSRIESALKKQADGSFLLSGPYKIGGASKVTPLIRLVIAQAGAVNISTRLGVGTGDNVLIEGFIVDGPAGSSKKILVRALGPSLTQFGIGDALPNPILEIHNASDVIVATNDDWKTTQIGGLITGDQFAEINATGAAPANTLESAVIASLQPGSYTAVVRGAGNGRGTGVVDAFDLNAGSSARLANIATRGVVEPGEKLMIAGFIVQNGAVKLVVRAIGPSLQQFGISNALSDTTLQLRDQQGTILLENDDWQATQKQELESIGLQPSHDREAALVTTIQPGLYTAQIRGKGNESGVGVVQVYFLQ